MQKASGKKSGVFLLRQVRVGIIMPAEFKQLWVGLYRHRKSKGGGEVMGRMKKFKSGNELVELFDEFCRDIVTNKYNRIPSQTEFCNWLEARYDKTDRKTIYNALNKYFPTVKKDFERLQSDLIAQGGMLGWYKNTMSIFVLKNWCNWTDKSTDDDGNTAEDRIAGKLVEIFGDNAC